MLQITFHNLQFQEVPGYALYVKYFASLQEIIDLFNQQMGKSVRKLYNQYGQELPLTYKLQKTGLDVYY